MKWVRQGLDVVIFVAVIMLPIVLGEVADWATGVDSGSKPGKKK